MMGRVSRQQDLFQVAGLVEPNLERDSVYVLLHHLGEEYLSDDDFAPMYSHEEGRRSLPPSLLARVCLLQRHDNVSDREAVRRVQFDLRWLYALRLPIGYPGFAHANLSHFRSRLIVHGLERVTFDRFNEAAIQLGVLDPTTPHAIDSSHIFGAAAVQDTYDLLRSALRGLLGVLVQQEPAAAGELVAGLNLEDYQSTEKPAIDWADPAARAAWLTQVVQDSRALLRELNGSALLTEESQEAAKLLAQILNQDIVEPDEPGDPDNPGAGPRLRQGTARDRIISTVDPEMRHGRKSQAQRFDGYKVHITEQLESQLITNVQVTPGNAYDGEVLVPMLVEQQEKLGAGPTELLGDSQYGSVATRANLQQADLDVRLVAKLPGGTTANNRLSKQDFVINLEAGTVTCPAGHVANQAYASQDNYGRAIKQFRFPAELCHACRLRERCTRSRRGRSISLHYHEDILQAARTYNATPEFEQRYRQRTLVERKLGELLWRHGLRSGRYFGVQKTRLQAFWTAAVVNLKRLGKLITGSPGATQTAPTPA